MFARCSPRPSTRACSATTWRSLGQPPRRSSWRGERSGGSHWASASCSRSVASGPASSTRAIVSLVRRSGRAASSCFCHCGVPSLGRSQRPIRVPAHRRPRPNTPSPTNTGEGSRSPSRSCSWGLATASASSIPRVEVSRAPGARGTPRGLRTDPTRPIPDDPHPDDRCGQERWSLRDRRRGRDASDSRTGRRLPHQGRGRRCVPRPLDHARVPARPAPHRSAHHRLGRDRHDGLHNWWELHPLVGWQPGNVAAPPGTGTGSSD